MASVPWTQTPDGLTLTIRLTPKSSRDVVEGVETLADGKAVLKARVRAAPEDGKANDSLLRMLSKTLGLPQKALTLSAGATSRVKTIRLAGDGLALAAALERLCGPAPKG